MGDGLSGGDLILEQSAIPSLGVPSLLSEYAFLVHSPLREATVLREKVIFSPFISHFKPDSICGTDQKKMVSVFRCIKLSKKYLPV